MDLQQPYVADFSPAGRGWCWAPAPPVPPAPAATTPQTAGPDHTSRSQPHPAVTATRLATNKGTN